MVKVSVHSSLSKRVKSDLLVLPFWQEGKEVQPACSLGTLAKFCEGPIQTKDFQGKAGEIALIYASGTKEPRIALVGLGKKTEVNGESLRRAYGSIGRRAIGLKATAITTVIPSSVKEAKGLLEGLLSVNYSFDSYKSKKRSEASKKLITHIHLVGSISKANVDAAVKTFEGVYLARDLVNHNAGLVNPSYLVRLGRKLGRSHSKMKVSIFDKKRLEKEKMGLILAVGQGSAVDPAMVIMEYRGAPKSKDTTVLVGKGVTYDTGGLNLKPTGSIETMKCDMGGSAVVFGTMDAIAKLGLKINVTGVVPTTENAIDAASYKPGDVHTGYSGTSVEIGNTDAEGRLILADALAYAVDKLGPTRIINFATLTGAMVIALGSEASGLMSNNDKLAKDLAKAGDETFERVWRLPLHEEYKELLKSDIADLKNIGGRSAGSITAGLFLQEFVGKVPWAHCDIAGTAYLSSQKRYWPKNGTGFGVRLMVQYLESLA